MSKKHEAQIAELEETIYIVSVGSESEAVQRLGASLTDKSEENKKLKYALYSVLGIVEGKTGEAARQIRDILNNVLVELGDENNALV